MIKLPFEIIQLLWSCGNNRVEHLNGFATEFSEATFDIVSTSPFVIRANNTEILLTRDENDHSIDGYQYVVLTNKIPRKSEFLRGNILSIRWIKHPKIDTLRPEEITASWRGKFLYKKENIQESILGLRAPQLGAIYAFMSKAQIHHGRNIIVMPTGTGKTETMLSILIANQCAKVLVTVPSDALRDQLANKFFTLGVLHKFGIVTSDCSYPNVGIVKEGMDYNGWYTLIEKSNVIITTMPLITNCESEIINLLKENISHLFVDEAHHSEAKTWSEFIDSFDDEKVTLFTATPFRNDSRRLKGDFIYNFSLKDAQSQGYYKPIKFIPIREYDLIQADKHIAEVAVKQLRSDMENGYDHILMARCSTKQRAKEVMEIYQQYSDLNPVMVFSSMPNQKSILNNIKDKKHKIIVCVNMLGEGFDMPELKIAAIHDAKQSLPITLWKSHATLTLLATQDCPLWLQYD
ncbi:DEAD/DEAH box helicase [Odoribacter splanchnicus]|uniref:DEAD/DEAH box helicase n=1 Tax=Odoribacter splanchnicus TaxID=28118 RepID=UPI001E49174D|nr:DEAD/DEAH box helicase family protein [Odoribacter splanchnicus]